MRSLLSLSAAAFAVSALLCLPVLPARGQLVQNGTFDTVVPSNGTGGGWTSSNIDGLGGHRTTGGNPDSFFILNDAGQLVTDPTLTQTVSSLIVGATYNVTGDFRTVHIGQNTGTTQAFGVAIDGAYLFESPGVQNTNWNSFSFNFVAPATSVALSLAAERNGTDNDFGVDNIAMTLVPGPAQGVIPEPGTCALLTSGLLPLAGAVLRRRRKA